MKASLIKGSTGKELIVKKIKYLSLMAGAFVPQYENYRETNIIGDIPSAKKMVTEWPTEMIFSGYEIGRQIQHPAESMKEDYGYVKYHPLRNAYHFYIGLDNTRSTYDLTSVLYVVRPNRGYFDLSPSGTITVLDDGRTRSRQTKAANIVT